MSVIRELGLYLCSKDGSNDALSPVVHGVIVLSINIQYRTQSRPYYKDSQLKVHSLSQL